nr:immunoglobulin heavy chain junction region [Mus musculus]
CASRDGNGFAYW